MPYLEGRFIQGTTAFGEVHRRGPTIRRIRTTHHDASSLHTLDGLHNRGQSHVRVEAGHQLGGGQSILFPEEKENMLLRGIETYPIERLFRPLVMGMCQQDDWITDLLVQVGRLPLVSFPLPVA